MTIRQNGGVFGRHPEFSSVSVPDGGAIYAGSDQDLKIYHDGSNSYILDQGTGGLYIRGSNELALRSQGNKNIFLGITDGAAYIYHNGSVKLATASSGVSITGNVIVDSGNGIDFSATSGTGTSELFDDYEEGTWTPVLYGTTTAGSQTYTWQRGTYTKIGNRVIADFTILIGTKDATTAGQLEISGLPFTVNVNAGIPQAAFAFRSNMALQTNAYYHTVQPKINTAVIILGQAGSTVVNTGDTAFASGNQLVGSVQYYV